MSSSLAFFKGKILPIEEAQVNFNKRFARYRDVYTEEFPEVRADRPSGRTEQDIATEKLIKKNNN